MLEPLLTYMSTLWGRLNDLRHDDRGMTTEAMIITALLAAAAIGAVTVIATAIRGKGDDISNQINGGG